MVATALLLAFFLKGICDYVGNYLVSYAGFASVTHLRNAVFEKVLKQGAEFFEAHSTGQLMSSIMNDVDKVQVATSQILADLLRQWFTALASCCSCSSATTGGWPWPASSCCPPSCCPPCGSANASAAPAAAPRSARPSSTRSCRRR